MAVDALAPACVQGSTGAAHPDRGRTAAAPGTRRDRHLRPRSRLRADGGRQRLTRASGPGPRHGPLRQPVAFGWRPTDRDGTTGGHFPPRPQSPFAGLGPWLGRCGRGVTLVHATSLAAPPARRARLTVMVHDTAWRRHPEAYPARGRRWHEAALARVVGGADAVVVPSSAVADDLVEAGAAPCAVHVVEHGSDHLGSPDDLGAAALLQSLGVEGSFLMSVGTLEPRKNLARLVEAYQRGAPQLGGPP